MTNENINRPSYFSILTADVRYDKDLSASEKIFYSEITCLCQADGFCYASNSYFSNLYNCDVRTIRNWVSKLANKNYIKVEYDKITSKRKIYIIIKSEISKENENRKNIRKVKECKLIKEFYDRI